MVEKRAAQRARGVLLHVFHHLLGELAVVLHCEELQVLEEVVAALYGAEGNGEGLRFVGIESGGLRRDLEDGQGVAVDALASLLGPKEGDLALHAVGDQQVLGAAHGHEVAEAEVHEVLLMFLL